MYENDIKKIGEAIGKKLELEKKIKENEFKIMELTRKRWELKNMCIKRVAN